MGDRKDKLLGLALALGLGLGLGLSGCWAWPGNAGEEEQQQTAAPPAAAIASLTDTMSIGQQLALLERLAIMALQDDELRTDVLQAEAITDRLLEAPLSFEWTAGKYSIETRLRQLQSQADRVVARLSRGDAVEDIRQDVTLFREQVQELRRQLGEPGGPAPPPLDSLLAAGPTSDDPSAGGPGAGAASVVTPEEPTEPGGPRLLGQPSVSGEQGTSVQPDTMQTR